LISEEQFSTHNILITSLTPSFSITNRLIRISEPTLSRSCAFITLSSLNFTNVTGRTMSIVETLYALCRIPSQITNRMRRFQTVLRRKTSNARIRRNIANTKNRILTVLVTSTLNANLLRNIASGRTSIRTVPIARTSHALPRSDIARRPRGLSDTVIVREALNALTSHVIASRG